jgi:flagellar protein FlaG
MTDGGIQITALDTLADAGQVVPPSPATSSELTTTPLEPAAQEQRPHTVPVITPEELGQAVQAFDDAISTLNRGVRFHVDKSEGRLVAQVIDRDTNEVLRQIPPEEFLELASRLRDFVGLLFDIEI